MPPTAAQPVRRFLTFIVLTCLSSLILGWVPKALAQNTPLNLTFEKSDPNGDSVWEGAVAGDIEGGLTTSPTSVDDTNPVWEVEFDFIIEAGEQSMTIHLIGTLDTETGVVLMSGEVTEGYMQGAQVQEEGQLVDPETSTFQGTIRIEPRTTDRNDHKLRAAL